ncbi:hypothetical protein M885DRAFT_569501 [Pelagophyceae sp. CCMP2097]|nr:hypothetical protein M885DRAFT_569501 [Pelagophyceae sp. CCMP2097]
MERLREVPDLSARVLHFLGTDSLLRYSEVDARARNAEIVAGLFPRGDCVHCGAAFSALDNRVEGCMPIQNKRGRRHKGPWRASARELRNVAELISNRQRISSGAWRPRVTTLERCAGCASDFPGWTVPDEAWRSIVPAHRTAESLCRGCFLNLENWQGALQTVRRVLGSSTLHALICLVAALVAYAVRHRPALDFGEL